MHQVFLTSTNVENITKELKLLNGYKQYLDGYIL